MSRHVTFQKYMQCHVTTYVYIRLITPGILDVALLKSETKLKTNMLRVTEHWRQSVLIIGSLQGRKNGHSHFVVLGDVA